MLYVYCIGHTITRHMGGIVFRVIDNFIVYSRTCSNQQNKSINSSTSFRERIHQTPLVSSRQKGPVTQSALLCHDVTMVRLFSSGYGNISPSSTGGRVFVIPYALIGIPLMLIFLTRIGNLLCNLNKRLVTRLRCECCTSPRLDQCLKSLVMFFLGGLCFIVIPALAFSQIDDWSYDEGVYFCIVTLSTIGFGDYIAGE